MVAAAVAQRGAAAARLQRRTRRKPGSDRTRRRVPPHMTLRRRPGWGVARRGRSCWPARAGRAAEYASARAGPWLWLSRCQCAPSPSPSAEADGDGRRRHVERGTVPCARRCRTVCWRVCRVQENVCSVRSAGCPSCRPWELLSSPAAVPLSCSPAHRMVTQASIMRKVLQRSTRCYVALLVAQPSRHRVLAV